MSPILTYYSSTSSLDLEVSMHALPRVLAGRSSIINHLKPLYNMGHYNNLSQIQGVLVRPHMTKRPSRILEMARTTSCHVTLGPAWHLVPVIPVGSGT